MGSSGEDAGKEWRFRVHPHKATPNLLNKKMMLTRVLLQSGSHGDPECLNAHSTCPAHGWPGPFQRTQSFSSERDILLGGGKAFRFEELSSVLITQNRMHSLQEVLPALWGAVKRRWT